MFIHDCFEKRGAAERVYVNVLADLVHGLANAHRRCLVEDDLRARDRSSHIFWASNVSSNELSARVEVGRRMLFGIVDLGRQIVKNAYFVPLDNELIHEMGTYESGPASHQNSCHLKLLLLRIAN